MGLKYLWYATNVESQFYTLNIFQNSSVKNRSSNMILGIHEVGNNNDGSYD